ncbi:hypothetical protein FBEOM_2415 [Fusarium beomiforme]|uniref:Uncharacterized protein n=1 Tax=Fusarium beomiforme TaxID=44412 RepID=A0A9P5E059_9HYPO|nr:hypothetical protein FBEOM_2415 [Fusarium beomiforme]
MSGGGYQNTGSMEDSRALQSSFHGKSQNTVLKKRTGPSMQESRVAPGTRSSRTQAPVTRSGSGAPSTVERKYTETLSPDPFNRAPGSILGLSPLEFLSRRDTAPQLSAKPVQGRGNEANLELPSTTSTAPGHSQIRSKPIQEEAEKADDRLPPATAAVLKSPKHVSTPLQRCCEEVPVQLVPTVLPTAISEAPKSVSNVELLRELATDPGQASVQSLSTATPKLPPMLAQCPITPNSLLAKMLSKLREDKGSGAGCSADQAKEEPVHESNAATFLRYSSDELLEPKRSAKNVVLPADCRVKRRNSHEKQTIAAVASVASRLLRFSIDTSPKPQAEVTESTVSIPTAPQTSRAHAGLDRFQALAKAKAEPAKIEEVVAAEQVRGKHESKGLRPQVPGFVPRMHASSATVAPTQHATSATTSFIDGHGVGPPRSLLVQGPSYNVTSSAELPLQNVNDTDEAVRAPRKPTKGLGASMWAK